MDNCIESTGDFPDSIDYTQKLDFRFIDPGPDDVMCKRQRYFAFEVTFKVEWRIVFFGDGLWCRW